MSCARLAGTRAIQQRLRHVALFPQLDGRYSLTQVASGWRLVPSGERMSHDAARSRSILALALVVLLGIVACVPSPSDSAATPSPGSDPRGVAAEVAAAHVFGGRLDEDGTIPLDLALDLFATTFGPIDGGETIELPGRSGSIAIRGILRHWDELSPGQRAAVDAVLVPAGDTAGAPGVASAAGSADLPDTEGSGFAVNAIGVDEDIRGLTSLVTELRDELEGRLGRRLEVPIEASASSASADPTIHALTWATKHGRPLTTGRMDTCQIAVLPPAWDLIDTPQFRTMLAHEVMHCFQFDGAGGVGDVRDAAQWIVEGGATFAAMAVAPTDYYDWTWQSWLGHPGIALYKRAYDAIGVFAVAEQEGVDVWEHLVALLQADDASTGIELLFDRPPDDALTAVARRLVREPSVGRGWESNGPGITATQGSRGIYVADGSAITDEVTILPFASAGYVLGVDGASEVIDIAIQGGQGLLGVPETGTEQIGTDFAGRYCLTGFCTCPEGDDVGGTELNPGDQIGIALTSAEPSGGTPSTVTLQASTTTLAEACGNRLPGEILVVRFEDPESFEVHGGHCIVQDSGDLLIQAGDDRKPDDYRAPPEHREDVSISIYKNPTTEPHSGSVDLRIGGTQFVGDSSIIVSPDHLSGSFALDSGYAGEWVCAELVTPDEAFGTG